MGFLREFKKGIAGEPDGDLFTVGDKRVTCAHCGGERFAEGRAQLNTAGLTFFGLDWANRSAATLACKTCGRIEWFLTDPEIAE